MLIESIVGRIQGKTSALVTAALRLSGAQSLAIAQTEPELLELTRAGRRFAGGGGIATAVGQAPVATIPTTAAQFLLYNGESDGGKSLIIDYVTIVQLSGTAAVGSAILAALTTTKITAPAMGTGYAIASMSRSSNGSKAVMAVAQTITASQWFALGANGNPATTTNGGQRVDVKGGIIVPPGYGLAIAVVSGAGTTPLNLCWIGWSELELDLE